MTYPITRSQAAAPLTAAQHDGNLRSGGGFPTIAAMLADTTVWDVGTIIRADCHRYEVVASASHLVNAGGAHLKVLASSGGWYDFGAFNPAADGTTDDYAKLIAAIEAVTIEAGPSWQISGPTLVIPEAIYKINSTVNLKRYVRIIGNYSGHANSMGPIFLFAADTTGIIVNRSNTLGTGVEDPATTASEGPLLEGIRLHSLGGTDVTKHGLWMRARAALRNFECKGFPGNGVNIVARAGDVTYENTFADLAALQADTTDYGTGGNYAVDELVFVTADSQIYAVLSSVDPEFDVENAVGVRFRAVDQSTVGGDEGNANLWTMERVYCTNNGRNGVYVQGADSNAGLGLAINCNLNGRWGIWDNSFLGNTWVGCHTANNGMANTADNGATKSSVVFHTPTTGRYVAHTDATEAELVATEPGSVGSEKIWLFRDNNGPYSGSPEWQAGQPEGTYHHGGNYYTTGANARNVLIGCYGESGSAGSSFYGPTIVIGGLISEIIKGSMVRGDSGGDLEANTFQYNQQTGAKDYIWLGKTPADEASVGSASGTILAWGSKGEHTPSGSQFRLKRIGEDWYVDYGNLGANRVFRITGPDTSEQMGTGVAQKTIFALEKLGLGVGTNTRRQTTASAVPTTGTYAQGDIVWNTAPTAGGVAGWMCVTAGTPGAWATINLGAAI